MALQDYCVKKSLQKPFYHKTILLLIGAIIKRTALTLTLTVALLLYVISGTRFDKVAKANPGPIEPLTPPVIEMLSPENMTYVSRNVTLAFITREPDIPWNPCYHAYIDMVAYRLDGSDNNLLLISGREKFYNFSLTLSSLSEGSHSLKVLAWSESLVALSIIERGGGITVYFNIDTTSPAISVLSPKSITFNTTDIELDLALNEPASWTGYSIDNEANVTITGNTTLARMPEGPHELIVYANDTYGNMGSSEKINFTIAKEPEPFPTTLVIAVLIASMTVVGAGLAVYFRKRKH